MIRALCWAALLVAPPALADSWAPPPKEPQNYFSANKKFTFVVTPGNGRQHASGVMFDQKGTTQWTVTLLNPYVPLEVLVSDDGRYLATFDDYFGSGGANAAVLYEWGKLRAHLNLPALVSERESRNLPRSVSSVMWLRQARFDLPGGKLILGINAGGNRRPTEEPGPALERHVDLATGKVIGRPEEKAQTPGSLLEELKTTKTERSQVLQDLAQRHNDAPEVVAQWRAMLFDEQGPVADRSFALRQLENKLTDAELTRLLKHLPNPKDPMAPHVLSVVVQRKFKPALPQVLEACKQRTELDGNSRQRLVEAALKLSDYRDDVLPMALDSKDVYLEWTTLSELTKLNAGRARPYALARLNHPEDLVRSSAEKAVFEGLRRSDPEQGANYDALLALARDGKSVVAKSSALLLVLGRIAFDRKHLEDAHYLHGLGQRLAEPKTVASHLAQLAYVELAQGNAAACVATSGKLLKLPKEREGCRVGWRPSKRSSGACDTDSAAELGAQLRAICAGPVRARIAFVPKGSVLLLEVDLENLSATDFDSAGKVQISWSQGGEEVDRTDCYLGVKLPGKTRKTATCQPRLSSSDGTASWPVRADVQVTLYAKDSKEKKKDKKMKVTELQAMTYLVR